MSDSGTFIPRTDANDSPQLRRHAGARIISRTESTVSPSGGVTFETKGATALAPVIDIDRLWETPPGLSSQVVDALELLRQVVDLIGEAKKSDNPIEADSFTQRAQLALPKLFSYRSISDGFGVVINSLYFAFMNLRGMPLAPEQLDVIWRVLRELRAHPALSLEQGIQFAEELEDRGLEVDPPDLDDLFNVADPHE